MDAQQRRACRAMGLREFYGAHFRRLFLADARPRTHEAYRETLAHWERLTTDPPLRSIDVETLAAFRDGLHNPPTDPPPWVAGGQLLFAFDLGRGRPMRPHRPATCNKHLRTVGAILAKAGPPGPGARDALAVIDRVPWVRPLREERIARRAIPPEVLGLIYNAAMVADHPRLPGLRPADWWRALVLAAFTTGFRRGALLALRWSSIDLIRREITLPPELDKCGCGRRKPISGVLIDHLARIRTASPLVFPWTASGRTFDRQWYRIQAVAGLGPGERFRFHDLKRACATAYAAHASPGVTQLICDHATLATTIRYYQDPAAEARRAVDALPLPGPFLAISGGDRRGR